MRRPAKALIVGLVTVPVIVAVAIGAAYVIDRAVTEDEVGRNVALEGQSISGLGEADVTDVIRLLGEERLAEIVEIRLPDLTISAPAVDLGIRFDETEAVKTAMLAARRDGTFEDFGVWWDSLFGGADDKIDLEYWVDPAVIKAFVANHPERVHRLAVEPYFTGVDGPFDVQRPVTGQFLDDRLIFSALESALGPSRPPAFVDVEWGVEPTVISMEQFEAAFDDAQRLATRLTVVVNGRPAIIGSESVRRWIDSAVIDGEFVPVFAPERVESSIERLLAPLSTESEVPTFAVVDGEVVLELGLPAYRCCAPGATDALFAAALDGGRHPVDLPERLVEEDMGLGRAEALGVTELISTFTTRHKCCENRVSNIHRIADLVRGQVIEPGESFSINDFIGPRTIEKGFVTAGIISQGHFVEDVGGGISQFATTMFNAAFFAGLEFNAYRAHSIYISRYPYGREATLSFPEPDLDIVNNTPFGIVIWTSYTDTTITVQMYSTKYWEVEQTGQTSSRVGSCTRVNTFRTRTAPDGSRVEDMVFATYRPGEGLDCNGRAIPKP